MPLVSDSDVKALIATDRDTTPFIATADVIITEDLSSQGMSQARLTQIELYLAAHFVAIAEERGALVLEKIGGIGGSEEQVAPLTGQGFMSTRFGQQAIQLDTSGVLRRAATTKYTAEFAHIKYPQRSCD